MSEADEPRNGNESELRLRDLIEELQSVNELSRRARGWREKERLQAEKSGLVSAAIILLGANTDTLWIHYQVKEGRSHRYVLVTLIACGCLRSVHVPVDQLTNRARLVVEKALGQWECPAEEPECLPATPWRMPHFAMS